LLEQTREEMKAANKKVDSKLSGISNLLLQIDRAQQSSDNRIRRLEFRVDKLEENK